MTKEEQDIYNYITLRLTKFHNKIDVLKSQANVETNTSKKLRILSEASGLARKVDELILIQCKISHLDDMVEFLETMEDKYE